MIVPAWTTWARSQIGVREIVGSQDNQVVVDYWKQGDVALDVNNDETPWCAAFVAAALVKTGYSSTRSGLARSYERDKTRFVDCEEVLGAIAVFSSSAGPNSGHVGFIESADKNALGILGGNQGNRVSIAPFPRSRLLRVCWPAKAPRSHFYPPAPTSVGGTVVSDR
jgi:uncharacterized protein (TIGR02594 family)